VLEAVRLVEGALHMIVMQAQRCRALRRIVPFRAQRMGWPYTTSLGDFCDLYEGKVAKPQWGGGPAISTLDRGRDFHVQSRRHEPEGNPTLPLRPTDC
jgi:hypothetical protein